MSYFGLDPTAEQNLLNTPPPVSAEEAPGFLAGAGMAALQGLASAARKTQLTAEVFEESFTRGRDAGTVLQDDELTAMGEKRQRETVEAIRALRPDPRTTGVAGEVLFGLGDVGARAMGAIVTMGPLAGAALAGGTETIAQSEVMQAEGVDAGTAVQVGAIQGAAVGLGALLPAGVGSSLATRIASGVGINVGVGMASRGATSTVLSEHGYTAQAEQYRVMDAKSLVVDAVLGAAFGGISRTGALADAPRAVEPKPAPSDVAAANTINDSLHVELDTAPGLPVTPAARDTHVDNLVRASEALMRDEPVPQMRDVEVVPQPGRKVYESGMARAADGVVERRADGATRARVEDMAPEQQVAEIAWLREENSRLNNELRTDPLTGLGNKVAWKAVEADTSLPYKVMMDVDSLKWVNDNLGHEAGDAYLQEVGKAINRAKAENAARLGGDEFAFASKTEDEARSLADLINQESAKITVEATLPDGTVITKTGAGISYGIGKTRGEADANLYRNKAERTEQGLRGERGTEPGGVARRPAGGQQGQISDGSPGVDADPLPDGSPGINPETRDAEGFAAAAHDESATAVLAEQPGLIIVGEDGRPVPAAAALAEADAELALAQQDANLFNVAVSCFLRNGA